ncbi:Aspartate aminotransferase [Thermus aquaticus]|uniref:Aspartate aminotransferase n=1 Tax=Thermus aquaticus TaxID=271 RepID=A0A0M9AHZ0_THEAQ|nr:Aspartate aminotransferase [Thermus aquaticus]
MAFIAMAREAYRKRRDLLLEGLSRIGLEAVRPSGAFYVLMDTSPFAPNEVEAAERLLMAGGGGGAGTDFAALCPLRPSFAPGGGELKKGPEGLAPAP